MKLRIVLVAILVVPFAMTAPGQVPTGLTGATMARGGGTATFSGPPSFTPPAVVGAPYSAEEISEQVQTLMDGTHITQKTPGRKMYRDSQGRTRTERPLVMRPITVSEPANVPMVVEINDPVAGFRYTLDAQSHVAHRVALPPAGAQPGSARRVLRPTGEIVAGPAVVQGVLTGRAAASPPAATAQGGELHPQVASESLGTQVVNGVLAEGTRRTMTFPVGMQGNDRPIVTTSETWTSPDLKVTVLSKSMDPRSGEHTMQLINLSRTEPDPSLFAVPPDYSVVDETAPFSIRYSIQ